MMVTKKRSSWTNYNSSHRLPVLLSLMILSDAFATTPTSMGGIKHDTAAAAAAAAAAAIPTRIRQRDQHLRRPKDEDKEAEEEEGRQNYYEHHNHQIRKEMSSKDIINSSPSSVSSLSSSSTFYDGLLTKMTKDNGVWQLFPPDEQHAGAYEETLRRRRKSRPNYYRNRRQEVIIDENNTTTTNPNITTDTTTIKNTTTDDVLAATEAIGDQDAENYFDIAQSNIQAAYLPHEVFIAIICLGLIGIGFGMCSCAFVYTFRTNKLVAIGQPPFLYLIIFGCILLSTQIFFLFRTNDVQSQKVLDASCIATMWFNCLGWLCIYMGIIMKLQRAQQVMTFRRNQQILVRHVIKPFIGILVVALIILTTKTIIDPPFWDTNMEDFEVFTNTSTSETTNATDDDDFKYFFNGENGYCNDAGHYDDASFTINWFTTSMLILYALLMFVVLYMSCVTRNLPEEVSDSRHVFIALCANCCTSGVTFCITILALIFGSIGLSVFSEVLNYFIHTFVILGFLIGPKMHAILYVKTHDGRLPRRLRNSVAIGGGRVRVGGIEPTGNTATTATTITRVTCTNVNEENHCVATKAGVIASPINTTATTTDNTSNEKSSNENDRNDCLLDDTDPMKNAVQQDSSIMNDDDDDDDGDITGENSAINDGTTHICFLDDLPSDDDSDNGTNSSSSAISFDLKNNNTVDRKGHSSTTSSVTVNHSSFLKWAGSIMDPYNSSCASIEVQNSHTVGSTATTCMEPKIDGKGMVESAAATDNNDKSTTMNNRVPTRFDSSQCLQK